MLFVKLVFLKLDKNIFMHFSIHKATLIVLVFSLSQVSLVSQVKTDSAYRAERDKLDSEYQRLSRESTRLINDLASSGTITIRGYYETDHFVYQGDTLSFVTQGKISTGNFSGYTGPGGHLNYTTNMFNIVTDKPYGAFLCKIGEDGEYIVLGDSIQFIAQTSGRLTLLVNDKDRSDNLGQFKSRFFHKSSYSYKDRTLQKEGNLVYLTENQRKELDRIRAERKYREENKERLAEEALREKERKRAERLEAERVAREESKRKNRVTLSDSEAKDLFYACIGYTLAARHEENFRIDKNSNKPSKRISETTIEVRKVALEGAISVLVSKGAESQISKFTESLQTAATRVTDPTNDLELANVVLNTMDSSSVGFEMQQLRKDVDLHKVLELIRTENKESILIKFFKSVGSGSFFGGDKRLWGLKNSLTGAIVVEPEYLSMGEFSEGLLVAQNRERNIGYIDDQGETAIPFIYKGGGGFNSGLAPVTKNKDRWGFIDKTGNVRISFKFSYANSFGIDFPGLAKVKRWLTDQVIYIDTTGKRVKNSK